MLVANELKIKIFTFFFCLFFKNIVIKILIIFKLIKVDGFCILKNARTITGGNIDK